jgi:hypothetical protein
VLIEELLVHEGIMEEGESLYSPTNIMLMHHVTARCAHVLFTRDVDYIVKDGEVIIVDEHTGRTMQGVAGLMVCTRPLKPKKAWIFRTKTRRWLPSPSRTISVCTRSWRG